MAVSFDASELNTLVADLHRAPAEVTDRVRLIVQKSAADVESRAKLAAPVDTGFLRSSIGRDVDGDGLGASVGPTANYGRFVEFGTSRMAPRAFMGPAFDRATPEFTAALEQAAGDFL